MAHDGVRLQTVDSIPLAVVRLQTRQADLPRVIPENCGVVWNALKAQGRRGGRHVAFYREWHPVIHLDVGAEMFEPFAERDGLVRSATPAGPCAAVTYFGPYHEMQPAHDAVHAWCKAGAHRLAGPSWEIYGHWQSEWDDDPSRIRTDIYDLLQP